MPKRKILRDGISHPVNETLVNESLSREIYGDAKQGVKDVVENVKVFASDNSEYLREFGLTMVYIKASGLIFFSLIMFVVGLIAILNPKPKMIDVEGTITTEPTCILSGETYNCNFDVLFNVENKAYTVSINTNSTKTYSKSNKIKVYYDPKNPQLSARIETDYSYSYIFYILMIIFGVAGVISAIIWIFISRKYSFMAQAEGLDVAAEKLRDIFT